MTLPFILVLSSSSITSARAVAAPRPIETMTAAAIVDLVGALAIGVFSGFSPRISTRGR
jgi:hypothetical protein